MNSMFSITSRYPGLRTRILLADAPSKQYSRALVSLPFHSGRFTSFRLDSGCNIVLRDALAEAKSAQELSVPNIWLRDHCPCEQCLDPKTRQRRVNTSSLAANPQIAQADLRDEGAILRICWRDEDHISNFSVPWIQGKPVMRPNSKLNRLSWVTPKRAVQHDPPEVQYDEVTSSEANVARLLQLVRQYGFCFVEGCPPTKEATGTLMSTIGPLENSHYGLLQEISADMASMDTAYTNEGLDVHTDTTYFSTPVRLQLMHQICHDGSGGMSQFVDGFAAARRLADKSPWALKVLEDIKIMAHASGNEGISLQPKDPFAVISRDTVRGEISQIRWNNADRSRIVGHEAGSIDWSEAVRHWYDAARLWSDIIHSKQDDVFFEFKLQPGRPVIFDNWRILHGRSPFTGKRTLLGAYMNSDYLESRFRSLNIDTS